MTTYLVRQIGEAAIGVGLERSVGYGATHEVHVVNELTEGAKVVSSCEFRKQRIC